ncbi:MAG: hypothetical protein RL033_8058, partial [Pseudomonadota bacterium]
RLNDPEDRLRLLDPALAVLRRGTIDRDDVTIAPGRAVPLRPRCAAAAALCRCSRAVPLR